MKNKAHTTQELIEIGTANDSLPDFSFNMQPLTEYDMHDEQHHTYSYMAAYITTFEE